MMAAPAAQLGASPIAIARVGATWMDAAGKSRAFTASDLAGAAAAYDPENEPAPLVIGKPTLACPALGWIDHIELSGNSLVAHPGDMADSFVAALRANRYPQVQATWYSPDEPRNPRPGAWYLKHVAFTGGPTAAELGVSFDAAPSVPRPLSPARVAPAVPVAALSPPAVQATAFRVPPGYTVSQDQAALFQRATEIQRQRLDMPWMAAVAAARREDALRQGGAGDDQAGTDALRAAQLQIESPELSFVDAFRRARSERLIGRMSPTSKG